MTLTTASCRSFPLHILPALEAESPIVIHTVDDTPPIACGLFVVHAISMLSVPSHLKDIRQENSHRALRPTVTSINVATCIKDQEAAKTESQIYA